MESTPSNYRSKYIIKDIIEFKKTDPEEELTQLNTTADNKRKQKRGP